MTSQETPTAFYYAEKEKQSKQKLVHLILLFFAVFKWLNGIVSSKYYSGASLDFFLYQF